MVPVLKTVDLEQVKRSSTELGRFFRMCFLSVYVVLHAL